MYLVDGAGAIVYANPALGRWARIEPEQLVGQTCRFHSEPTNTAAESMAARLCPPPRAFNGERIVAMVLITPDDAPLTEQAFEYLPLLDEHGEVALIVALESEPSADAAQAQDASPTDAPHAAWHVALEHQRQQLVRRYRLDLLVGTSLAAKQLRAIVEVAIESRGHTLIVGPTGSGRQHLARTIHHAPPASATGLLLPLTCPLLGLDVMGSSLQAVAQAARAAATNGAPHPTLLLLDADQLAADAQAALLASLRENDPRYRVLATARAPLLTLSERGEFDRELAALLSTIVIPLPPLSARGDDLPLLLQAALEQTNRGSSRQVEGFSSEALDRLVMYAWPGNLDELYEVVRAAHAAAAGPMIMLTELPPRLEWASQAAARPRKPDERIVLPEFLAEIERELITRALRRTKGNKAKAARLLGLTRPRLYRRMVQLGLTQE